MSLDRVQNAVLQAAQREAALIVEKARKSAEAHLAQAESAEHAHGEQEFLRLSQQIEEEFRRQFLQEEAAARRDLLQCQHRLLERIFRSVRDQLLALPAPQYAGLMQRLLGAAAGDGGGKLRIHPEDQAVFSSVLEAFNADRAPECRITLDEQAPLAERGGFVFAGAVYEVDYTLAALLDSLEREQGPRVAAALFETQEGA